MWDGLSIGRITQQRGMPFGRPNISWGIILSGHPQLPTHLGMAETVQEAKDRFKAAWSALLPMLTAEDIEAEREWQAG